MRRLTIDSRMLAAAVLAAAVASLVLVATRPAATTPVLVVDMPAAAGTPAQDLALTERSVLDPTGLLPTSRRDEILDAVLSVDVAAGTPLTGALLEMSRRSVPDVVGVELDAAAAVHGALDPGDVVDVHLVRGDGALLAAGIPVVAVFGEDGALGVGDIGLLLAVDADLAPALIGAIHGDGIHLVRSGG